jgi:SAM-dependent methyltransferase
MAHIRVLSRLAYAYGREMLKTRSRLNEPQFLNIAYRALLKRDPDRDGLAHYLPLLQTKQVSRRQIITELLGSEEFRLTYGAPIHPLYALHQARIQLFKECLPAADIILDLGGAAHDQPFGALLGMGYPHHPKLITIVDLPPENRIGGAEHSELTQEIVTEDGVKIHYLYGSMANLSPIATASVDLVVSGESIEHISEEEAQIVCREAYRVLKPGGHFCVDTPNAALTRIESPNAFIHPEHQKEYYVHELREMLQQAGFDIIAKKGICPMPKSLRSGVFDQREMAFHAHLSDRPEECYLFFLHAVKPKSAA